MRLMGKNSEADLSEQGSSLPAISIPRGGGAIRGIGEKFAANPVNGTGSVSVPIHTSPGRSGIAPQLSLSYNSGAGNGEFGFGWSLSLPSITRKTDKGLPRYESSLESDVFILSGAEDLVPFLEESGNGESSPREDTRVIDNKSYRIESYRPRIEGLFARIERWTNQTDPADNFWRSISRDNLTAWYGKTENSRIADPLNPARVFSWLICESYDDKGNVTIYEYKLENSDGVAVSQAHERNRTDTTRSANRYPKRINYGNRIPYFPILAADQPRPQPLTEWLFEVVFDYGEHDHDQPTPDDSGQWAARKDPFSSYRAGFEVRAYRLCQRVLMFHRFSELGETPCLVRSTDFTYSSGSNSEETANEIFTFMISASQSGYTRRNDGSYLVKSMPQVEFEYSKPIVADEMREVDPESLENLPNGLDGGRYQWVDLDGEGMSGILTEQGEGWYYKRNLSLAPINDIPSARFGPPELVASKPSLASLGGGRSELMDLAGNGQLHVVQFKGPTPGFFERTKDEEWESFVAFEALPVVDWSNPNLRFLQSYG